MVIAQEYCLPPVLSADYPRHIGLHIDQAVDGKFRPDSKNNIAGQREQVTIQTKHLSYQPFDPVTPHSITCFSVNTDSQTIVMLCICQENHGKPVTSVPLAKPINALKFPRCPEQVSFRQSETFQQAQADNCFRPFALLLLITA